jgi:hypothetical protein
MIKDQSQGLDAASPVIHLRVPRELMKKLNEYKATNYVTQAEAIRSLLWEALEQRGLKNAA